MAADSKIIVEGVHVDQGTGHITLRVKTMTTDGKSTQTGPVRGYGCDAGMFQKRFNGDMQQLLNWVKSEHQAYQGAHSGLVESLAKLKGKAI